MARRAVGSPDWFYRLHHLLIIMPTDTGTASMYICELLRNRSIPPQGMKNSITGSCKIGCPWALLQVLAFAYICFALLPRVPYAYVQYPPAERQLSCQ